VWDRKVDEKDEEIVKEGEIGGVESNSVGKNGNKSRGKDKTNNQEVGKNTKSARFSRRKFEKSQEPRTPKFTNLPTNDSTSSNNEEFPNEGGNCKFCQKELPTGRRLCIHENYCRHRPASTLTFDNEEVKPLPLFEDAMAENEILENDISDDHMFNNEKDEPILPNGEGSDVSLGQVIAENCARNNDMEAGDLSLHSMNVRDTMINDSGIQNLQLAEEELIFSTNQNSRVEHDARSTVEIITQSNAQVNDIFTNAQSNAQPNAQSNAQPTVQPNTEISQFDPTVPIRTKIEPSISDNENTSGNENLPTNDFINESTQHENSDVPERKPKTEAMRSSTFLNEFNIDAYIASNAAVGNLDVLEVDSIENFTMS
jgi:hypothetical protein